MAALMYADAQTKNYLGMLTASGRIFQPRPTGSTKEVVMSTRALPALDLDRVLLDPGSSFRRPEDVIGDPRLRRQQKIEILCR